MPVKTPEGQVRLARLQAITDIAREGECSCTVYDTIVMPDHVIAHWIDWSP